MIVFAGPSIAGLPGDATTGLDIRGPAQQGDVFLASQEKPDVIGIIDGYFEGVPALWHKEILWAMKQGISVLGAASMGALRASELDSFGMEGVGSIYNEYASGNIEDDDEVALLHGPREMGYPVLSLAMVNARTTFDVAKNAGILSEDQVFHLCSVAKSQFYKERTWDAIGAAVDPQKIPNSCLKAFFAWLKDNETDQKQADAALLLKRMQTGNYSKPQADFHFEQTSLWLNAQNIWRDRQKEQAELDQKHDLFADREILGG